MPRCYAPDLWKADRPELHVFADASEYGFGAVAYVRVVYDGVVSCALLLAKSRNAPIKPLFIPRLELQAAVLAARLSILVVNGIRHTFSARYFWSDSTTVLRYIKNTSRRFHTFVANRVAEIHDLTDSDDWYYVPTHLNPADDCSRGLSAADLVRPDHR